MKTRDIAMIPSGDKTFADENNFWSRIRAI